MSMRSVMRRQAVPLSERAVARVEQINNRRIAAVDGDAPNPRPDDALPGLEELREAHAKLLDEWDAFERAGGRLPLIEDLFGGPQGNEGSWWRVGPLIAEGEPIPPLADRFPRTVAALLGVEGMRGAMWSVLGPGGLLPEHRGTNAAGLRLLVGVRSDGAELTLEGVPFPLTSGTTLLFDDTALHGSRNTAEERRVVILCDVVRPLPGLDRWMSAGFLIARHRLTPRYRKAPARAAEWDRALNGALAQRPDSSGARRS